jgi:hypothetical protein
MVGDEYRDCPAGTPGLPGAAPSTNGENGHRQQTVKTALTVNKR